MRRLKAENPAVSSEEIADTLSAACCPIVAEMANASRAGRCRVLRQFDWMLIQQLAANAMPHGSLIVANVPLPSAIDQKLGSQTQAGGQPTGMTVLTRAARQ
jgi:hypothetical protein